MRKTAAAQTGSVIYLDGKHERFDEGFYVVESTWIGGGGSDHGTPDMWPTYHEGKARKLNKDRQYDPEEESIRFAQGCSHCDHNIGREVEVWGKMKRIFVWEDE